MYQAIVSAFIFAMGLLWAVPGQAAVMEINEWSNLTEPGWIYATGLASPPLIDNATDTPSGGGALKFTYPAGTYSSSVGVGVAAFEGLAAPDLYVGFWFKYSSPFSINFPGSKIYYQYASLPSRTLGGNAYIAVRRGNDGVGIDVDIGILNNGAFASFPHSVRENVGSITIQMNRWYWMEIHTRVNTAADVNPPTLASVQPNGILQLWVDDVMMLDYNNIRFVDRPDVWKIAKHAPVWGGGGGTIAQTQYMWFDHTVLSTTRIGRPGFSRDTTPPRSPTNFTAY